MHLYGLDKTVLYRQEEEQAGEPPGEDHCHLSAYNRRLQSPNLKSRLSRDEKRATSFVFHKSQLQPQQIKGKLPTRTPH